MVKQLKNIELCVDARCVVINHNQCVQPFQIHLCCFSMFIFSASRTLFIKSFTKFLKSNFQSQSIQTLVHEAYTKYGDKISTERIEELRNKHRRRTVHQLEIDGENSVVKSLKDNG